MMFVYPMFLWALTALLIPIIIHLFNFRRYKKVYFTNVKFLKELQLESQSKSRLKELLILLSRLLAILCLVLAFAQPVLTSKQDVKANLNKKAIGIYVDNSFSMEGVNKQGPLLENAKRIAKNIVSSYNSNDQFHLITNDFEGKHQRLYSKEDILTEIEEIKISPAVKLYSDVLKRQKEFTSKEPKNTYLYAISDVQSSSFNVQDIKNDTLTQLSIIPLEANRTGNVYIDSCWFDSPVQQKGFVQKLHVTVQNASDKTIDAGTVRLTINGTQASIGSFSLEANAKKEISISFTSKTEGLNYASLKLDDFPITFDDELYFTFNSKILINTLVINGKENQTQAYFNSLFSTDSLFKFTELSENAIDYSKFKTADLIILNELKTLSSGLSDELVKFSAKGGCIVIIPDTKANIVNYNSFYKTLKLPEIAQLDTHALKLNKPSNTDPFFEGVFEKIDPQINLPVVFQHYQQNRTSGDVSQQIYTLQNNDLFLQKTALQNASIYLFSSSFDPKQSNFCKHALFVPTFIRIAVNSLKPQPLFHYLNNNSTIVLRSDGLVSETPPHVVGYKNKFDMIPEIRTVNNNLNLYIDKQLTEAGFYNIMWLDELKQNVAFNYNRVESNLNFYTLDELNNILSKNNLSKYTLIENKGDNDISKAIQLGANGVKLWKWFVLLTLFFIVIEICLIRFLK